MKKRILSVALVLALCLGLVPAAVAMDMEEVEFRQKLTEAMTRGELCGYVMEVFNGSVSGGWTDVTDTPTRAPNYEAIRYCIHRGIVPNRYGFGYGSYIPRGELADLLVDIGCVTSNVASVHCVDIAGSEQEDAIKQALSLGVMYVNVESEFCPDDPARATDVNWARVKKLCNPTNAADAISFSDDNVRTFTQGFAWGTLCDPDSPNYVADCFVGGTDGNAYDLGDVRISINGDYQYDNRSGVHLIRSVTATYDYDSDGEAAIPGAVVDFCLNDTGEIAEVSAVIYNVGYLYDEVETRTNSQGIKQVRIPVDITGDTLVNLRTWTDVDQIIGWQDLMGAKEGDAFLYYTIAVDRVINGYHVDYMYVVEKAEKVTGKVTATNSEKQIQVNGTWYSRTGLDNAQPTYGNGVMTSDGRYTNQTDFSRWNDKEHEFNFYLDKGGGICYSDLAVTQAGEDPRTLHGTCGAEGNEENVTWTLDPDGRLTISGTGAMVGDPTFNTWYDEDHNISLSTVVIEEGVTAIGDFAFADMGIWLVQLPDSLTSIGDGAFARCMSLYRLEIPANVTYIGDKAFEDCNHLQVRFMGDLPTGYRSENGKWTAFSDIDTGGGRIIYDGTNETWTDEARAEFETGGSEVNCWVKWYPMPSDTSEPEPSEPVQPSQPSETEQPSQPSETEQPSQSADPSEEPSASAGTTPSAAPSASASASTSTGGSVGGGGSSSGRPSGGGSSGGGGGAPAAAPADTTQTTTSTTASEAFGDVVKDSWYEAGVTYVVEKGLFNGVSETTFAPSDNMTRAMLMTVLARLDGQDTTGGDTWYAVGMDWAKEKGVSDGTQPEANVTREQMVTMLYRYAASDGAAGDLTDFADADQVSTWAQEAMAWAVRVGIITGKGDATLDPQGTATRAEVATIIQRYVEKLGQ